MVESSFEKKMFSSKALPLICIIFESPFEKKMFSHDTFFCLSWKDCLNLISEFTLLEATTLYIKQMCTDDVIFLNIFIRVLIIILYLFIIIIIIINCIYYIKFLVT